MTGPTVWPVPRFGGTGGQLTIGRKTFAVPGDAQVKHLGVLAYVKEPHRSEVHCFTELGEVEVPEPLAVLLTAKYFPETDS